MLARRDGARLVVAAVVLGGCAYAPSSFSFMDRPWAGTRATIGCLDLALTPRERAMPDRHAVLAYEFGNRCGVPVTVDLASARVIGRDSHGREYSLAAFDPDLEIRPAVLDGYAQGRELIAYPSGVTLVDICVDGAALTHQVPPSWLCVRPDSSR
jgi:hypothetical protein